MLNGLFLKENVETVDYAWQLGCQTFPLNIHLEVKSSRLMFYLSEASAIFISF